LKSRLESGGLLSRGVAVKLLAGHGCASASVELKSNFSRDDGCTKWDAVTQSQANVEFTCVFDAVSYR
jgi:hypothetical protein